MAALRIQGLAWSLPKLRSRRRRARAFDAIVCHAVAVLRATVVPGAIVIELAPSSSALSTQTRPAGRP